MSNHLRTALLAAALSSNIGALAAGVTITTRIAVCPTGGPGAVGGGSSGSVSTVSSTYGVYSLSGCYAAPSSGYLLDGMTTVSAGMTLASCASFCAGSTTFAVQNGNQCLCGSQSPTTAQIGAGSCGTKCSGDAAEDCGSSSSGIVYTTSHRGGEVSVTTYPTTLPNGVVSTVTSSNTFPPSPTGSVSTTVYTTTDPNGSQTVVTSLTTMPPVVPTTYTTTDAHGSQTVVTSSTTLPPPPPPSTSETTYVTTNAAGSIITTARTTVVQPSTSPKPPATSVNIQSSTSATTYITTNAAGSTITTARTTVVQPSTSSKPPATSVIVQSSTNAQGSVVVSSSTSTAPVPFSSSACGGTYSDNLGNLYHVDCGLAYLYNDLPSQTVSSFEACLEACDNYVPSANHGSGAPCVAVTYGIRTGGGECYLKYNIIQTKSANGEDSAYKIGSGVMPPVSTSNAPAPASSGSSNVVSTQTSRATSASTINPTAAAQPCPYSNGQPFIDQQGTVFDIACSVDYPGNDLTNPHCDTFQECILACDNYVPSPSVGRGQDCVAATWSYGNTGGNCFLKYAIDEIRYGNPNDNSCKLHNYTIPATVSSSSVGGSRTSTTNNVPVPATTSSSSSRPATTPLSSSTSNPVPVTSTSSSSSTTPSSISGTVSCPSQNNTIYTNSFGNQYEVNCGQQISGNLAYRNAHADSFDKCVDFCDLLPGCVAVTYPGDSGDITRANCYPYTSFRAWTTTSDTGLIAARPLGGGPNTGTNYNNVTLCPSYNNNVFTDPAHRQYEIGCDQGLSGTTYLYATVLQTLEACAIYCSEYSTCVGVTFTGYVVGSRASNCFPSSTYTSVTAQVGNSTAYVLR